VVNTPANTHPDPLDESDVKSNQKISLRQKRKEDALELASLIYDLYKESQSNVKIEKRNRGDDV